MILIALTVCACCDDITTASQVEVEESGLWFNAVKDSTMIGFTELPGDTIVFEEYADLGVHFVGGGDITICCDSFITYPQDGAGLKSAPPVIHLLFDKPQHAIACHFHADIQYELFYQGELLATSSIFVGFDYNGFTGIVSSTPFDEAVITNGGIASCDPFPCFVFIDNLYFTSSGPDCDGNGVFDFIDVLEGTVPDCNGNLIPDSCDIEAGTSIDCNENGVPDECDIASSASPDCNENGIPDECDVSFKTSDDCNSNGIPDECEVSHPIELASPQIGPIGNPLQPTHSFGLLPASATDVTLDFTAVADLDSPAELISVFLNGELIGNVFFAGPASDCADPPNEAQLMLTAEQFNAMHADEESETIFTFVPSILVDAHACDDESFVTIALSYQSFSPTDLDLDGVPDECVETCSADLDNSGSVTFADLLLLLDAWNSDDEGADLDGNDVVGFADLLLLLDAWGRCE